MWAAISSSCSHSWPVGASNALSASSLASGSNSSEPRWVCHGVTDPANSRTVYILAFSVVEGKLGTFSSAILSRCVFGSVP